MSGLLDEKSAIVTGGAGALGSAICRGLAAEGAHVHCLDVDEARCSELVEVVSADGGRATAHVCDVSNRQQVFDTFDDCFAADGRLDVLVNTAMRISYLPIDAFDEAAVDAMLSVGLKGTMWTVQAAAALMKVTGGGSVVNISSTTSLRTSAGHFVYASIKGAINALTMQAAVELGPVGVRVNAIAPGLVVHEANAGRLTPDFIELHERTTPLGRLGNPGDIAGAVTFLASDASRWVTGVTITVDGGRLQNS